jgi:hypothetical protein
MQPVSKKRLSKHVPAETNTFLYSPRRGVVLGTVKLTSCQLSVESQPVKRRQGDWCEIVGSLVPRVQLLDIRQPVMT